MVTGYRGIGGGRINQCSGIFQTVGAPRTDEECDSTVPKSSRDLQDRSWGRYS